MKYKYFKQEFQDVIKSFCKDECFIRLVMCTRFYDYENADSLIGFFNNYSYEYFGNIEDVYVEEENIIIKCKNKVWTAFLINRNAYYASIKERTDKYLEKLKEQGWEMTDEKSENWLWRI